MGSGSRRQAGQLAVKLLGSLRDRWAQAQNREHSVATEKCNELVGPLPREGRERCETERNGGEQRDILLCVLSASTSPRCSCNCVPMLCPYSKFGPF